MIFNIPGPPIPPYDAAGWTLAYQMGAVRPHPEGFEGPFVSNPRGELLKPDGTVASPGKGYILDARANQSYKAVNKLLNKGVEVYRIKDAGSGAYSFGSFYVPKVNKALVDEIKKSSAAFKSVDAKPVSVEKIRKARIALWDTYGGSMPSGWTRLIFEKFGFDYDVIYPKQIDSGKLNEKYDVIVFPGAHPIAQQPDTRTTDRQHHTRRIQVYDRSYHRGAFDTATQIIPGAGWQHRRHRQQYATGLSPQTACHRRDDRD